jgi:hypothetical protein
MSHYCNETIKTPAFSHLLMPERVKTEAGSGAGEPRKDGLNSCGAWKSRCAIPARKSCLQAWTVLWGELPPQAGNTGLAKPPQRGAFTAMPARGCPRQSRRIAPQGECAKQARLRRKHREKAG